MKSDAVRMRMYGCPAWQAVMIGLEPAETSILRNSIKLASNLPKTKGSAEMEKFGKIVDEKQCGAHADVRLLGLASCNDSLETCGDINLRNSVKLASRVSAHRLG